MTSPSEISDDSLIMTPKQRVILPTMLTLGLMQRTKLVPVEISFSISSSSCDLNLLPTDTKLSLPFFDSEPFLFWREKIQ